MIHAIIPCNREYVTHLKGLPRVSFIRPMLSFRFLTALVQLKVTEELLSNAQVSFAEFNI